jgi:hypothetical protein
MERGHRQSQPVQDSGAKALQDDVGTLGQVEEEVAPARGLEVEAQRSLLPVDRGEHRRGIAHQRGHPAHVIAAVEVLHLDDLGAKPLEDHGGEGSREQTGQVENTHTCQGHRVASVEQRVCPGPGPPANGRLEVRLARNGVFRNDDDMPMGDATTLTPVSMEV